MGVFIGASTQDRRSHHRRDPPRARARLFRGRARRAAGAGPAGRPPGPSSGVRGDRQAGRRRRPAPRPRSTSCCAHDVPTDPVALAQALIRCPSVTPEDNGAQDVVAAALTGVGFSLRSPALRGARQRRRSTISMRASATAHPHLMFAGHTDVVPPGDRDAWRVDPFAGEVAGRRALRPRRGRHEGRDRVLHRRRCAVSGTTSGRPARSAF